MRHPNRDTSVFENVDLEAERLGPGTHLSDGQCLTVNNSEPVPQAGMGVQSDEEREGRGGSKGKRRAMGEIRGEPAKHILNLNGLRKS